MIVEESDGWVLMAIHFSNGEAISREKLIRNGDILNHAILMDSEIDEGMGRLSKAGYAHLTDGGLYQVTDAGREFIRQVVNPDESPMRQMFAMMDYVKEHRV
jgi:hypothetical protein